MDVIETGNEYRLVAEVPGATRDTLEVGPGPVPGTLSLKVEARSKSEGQRVVRGERGERDGKIRYERVVPVAWDADATNARAQIENGILTVTVAKKKAPAPPSKKDVA